jgi:hypothetical protein
MLSDLRVRSLKSVPHDRWISDGNKLYLRVRATGARSWVLRRRKEDGGNLTLGTWPRMSLAQARVKAGSFEESSRTLGRALAAVTRVAAGPGRIA